MVTYNQIKVNVPLGNKIKEVRELRSWLKRIRIEKDLTHEDVANKCRIARSYYTHIENGTKTSSVSVAKRLGELLQIDWTIFFVNQCSLKEQKEEKNKKLA